MESYIPAPVILAVANSEVAERARRRITRRLLPYLLLLYLIAYIDRTNVSVAALDMTKATSAGGLGFSEAIIGFGAGVFFLGYFLLEIPGTLIVERWSARKWIARIMISWGLVATLMGFIGMGPLNIVSAEWQFYWLRFILGLAEAGFFPGVIVYLSHWFRYEDRGKAKAKFLIGIPLATVIGVPLSRVILENVHWYGLPGWRWVFILEGLPAILLGFITLVYLTDHPQQAHWLPADEKQWLVGELAREKAQKTASGGVNLRAAFQHPQIILLTVLYFFVVTSGYGLKFFLPAITQSMKGTSILMQTILTTLPYIFCIIAILLVGPSSDRTGERRWHTAIPMMLTGVGMALCVLGGDYLGVVILGLCLAGLAPGGYPAFWSLPSAFLTGSAAAGAVGLINSVGNLGGFVGPYIVGSLKDYTGNYQVAMLFLAGCALLGGLLATQLKPPKKQ